MTASGQLPRAGDMRITTLQDCGVWRIERWVDARWFRRARWEPVMLERYCVGPYLVPAEFPSRAQAEECLARLIQNDKETAMRRSGAWSEA